MGLIAARQDDQVMAEINITSFTDVLLVYHWYEDLSPWPPDTFSKQFAGIMRLADLEGEFRFHDSRHAFASIALKNGTSVKEVSTLLGHSSPTLTLTLSTYAHVMEGMGREAVNGLARSLLVPRQGEKSS